jgi:hypothetical protein
MCGAISQYNDKREEAFGVRWVQVDRCNSPPLFNKHGHKLTPMQL